MCCFEYGPQILQDKLNILYRGSAQLRHVSKIPEMVSKLEAWIRSMSEIDPCQNELGMLIMY